MYDVIIIGGGIIGGSVAWQLKQSRRPARILLLEKEREFGTHQTGHNSGVIHAGVYYEPGSLKARFCREGLSATLAFCRENGIPFEQCGKLLVATDDADLARMEALVERCRRNGLDPELLDAAELRCREPNVRGAGGFFVRETGIVDFRRICRRMLERFRDLGGELRPGTAVRGITEDGASVTVATDDGTLACRYLVCCAGLMSDRLAWMHGIDIDFQIVPFRGEFYSLPPELKDFVKHLIYPIPDPALPFLGVHLTRVIGGGIIVGPNAVIGWKREAYNSRELDFSDVLETLSFGGFWRLTARYWRCGLVEMRNSLSRRAYAQHVQRFCPDLKPEHLRPWPAGVRAQVVRRDGRLEHDFLFAETERSLHVCNAPSPAATSAIPIGRHICERIAERLG